MVWYKHTRRVSGDRLVSIVVLSENLLDILWSKVFVLFWLPFV